MFYCFTYLKWQFYLITYHFLYSSYSRFREPSYKSKASTKCCFEEQFAWEKALGEGLLKETPSENTPGECFDGIVALRKVYLKGTFMAKCSEMHFWCQPGSPRFRMCSLEKDSLPKNSNSVIICTPSCHSKTILWLIFETQIFSMKPERFLSLHW